MKKRKGLKRVLTTSAIALIPSLFFAIPIAYVVASWIYRNLGASGDLLSGLVWGTIVGGFFLISGAVSVDDAISETERAVKSDLEQAKRDADERIKVAMEEAKRLSDKAKNDAARVQGILEGQRQSLNKAIDSFEAEKEQFWQEVQSTKQDHPELAKAIADFFFLQDLKLAQNLAHKKNPALKASQQVKEIAKQKRELEIQNRKITYQLDFLYATVPFLEDYAQLAPTEAIRYTQAKEADEDEVKDWLSPEEYLSLPTAEKNQRALDRYMKRQRRNNWEAGLDYERYVGYVYESQGYAVNYTGATLGLEDLGIDLIATRGIEAVIIQCKRYSAIKSRVVRENTVAQLYGSAALYHAEHPFTNVRPVIYTSSELSEEAKHFSELLDIEVVDHYPLKSYPMIKCNISQSGEKIYHLPFDQQYDKVKIAGKDGAFFASTVAEAEALGFRRAYRWRPSKDA